MTPSPVAAAVQGALDGHAAPSAALADVLRRAAAAEDARPATTCGDLATLLRVGLPGAGRPADEQHERQVAAVMDSLGEQVTATLPADLVSRYFADRCPGTEVLSLSQLTGGFSKRTLLVRVTHGQGAEDLVVRQVLPGRDSGGLAAEHAVLRFAWERGVPAPEPLWLEPRPDVMDGPFFVTRRVAGSNVGDVFGPRPGCDPSTAHELARALAALHQLPADDAPAAPLGPMTSRDEVLAEIAVQEELADAAAQGDHPAVRELHAHLFAWLRAGLPAVMGRPVLLHGDPGWHNLLVEHGRVTALLDWERARLGEAAQDLAYLRPHVEQLLPWEEFLSSYVAAGGAAPDEERMRWYAVWHDTWRHVGAYRGRARLLNGSASVLDAVIGLLHAPRFLHAAVTATLASAA